MLVNIHINKHIYSIFTIFSDATLNSFKEKCYNFIIEQLRKCKLCPKAIVGTEIKIANKGQLFGIDPFYIEMNCNAYEQIPFTFDVPTIKQNTLKLLRGLQLKKPILLEGSPGVGKTSLVIALAKRTGNKIFRVNLSDQTVCVFRTKLRINSLNKKKKKT